MSNTTAFGSRAGAAGLLLVLVATTAGCATQPAPEYGGRWKAVNHYAETPQEIPLYQAYQFYPSPMDGTLKTMLERWARDSKMTLSYLHASDFTLHAAVAQIHTNDLGDAVSRLTAAYAGQGVSVTTEGNQIVVRSAAPSTATSVSDGTSRSAMP